MNPVYEFCLYSTLGALLLFVISFGLSDIRRQLLNWLNKSRQKESGNRDD